MDRLNYMLMKRGYALWFGAVLIMGCKKSFLELAPHSSIDILNSYKNANDIRVAVNGAYASLQSEGQYRTANWQVGEVRSDNSYNWEGGGNIADAEIDQFKEGSSNSILNSMWLDTYHGILLCNIVLDRIGGIAMSDTLKKQYTGEMQFLRALMYFNLTRTFGDVPLPVKEAASVEEGYLEGRAKTADVYSQIVADLRAASENLPVRYAGADVGRATRGAAKALIGKVFLTQRNYAAAALALKDVIDAGTYQLLPVYADLWKPANANSMESIFEVQYKKGGKGTGSPYTNFFAPRNSDLAVTVVGFAYGRNLPTADIISAYEDGDLRKNASIALTYKRGNQTIADPYTLKYRDVPYIEGDADNNWPVLRYADVMLMYAEALNQLNDGPDPEAFHMINVVRRRAGLAELAATLDKDAFAMAIEHERQVELAFEGHRWFDLLRTGRALDVMNNHFHGGITIQPFQLLFPVPQSQINVNPSLITQNDGY